MGAWIEIHATLQELANDAQSHPTMGAWIEIKSCWYFSQQIKSHPTMGAWIEIDLVPEYPSFKLCRTPRWVRGLKLKALLA